LHALQLQNDQYRQAYRALPRDEEIAGLSMLGIVSDEAVRRIWDTFRQEVQGLSDADYAKIVEGGEPVLVDEPEATAVPSPTPTPVVATPAAGQDAIVQQNGNGTAPEQKEPLIVLSNINVVGSVGMENYGSTYSISSLTPKAADMYMNEVYKVNKENVVRQMDSISNNLFEGDVGYFYSFNLTLFDPDGSMKNAYTDIQPGYDSYGKAVYNTAYAAATRKVLEIIKGSELHPGSLEKSMLMISIHSNLPPYGDHGSDTLYLELTPEQVQSVMDTIGPLTQV
jgi:hypothetical protein